MENPTAAFLFDGLGALAGDEAAGEARGNSTLTEIVRTQLVFEYVAMRDELVRFLTARLGQAALAEDIYQDVFVRLNTAQLPSEIGSPRAFLYRMAFNLANDHRRASSRRVARDGAWVDSATHSAGGEAIADHPDVDHAIDARREVQRMIAVLKELPPKCREVFTLHRLQGVSHRQIADTLGITTKTVEKHMTAALKQLTLKLRKRGET